MSMAMDAMRAYGDLGVHRLVVNLGGQRPEQVDKCLPEIGALVSQHAEGAAPESLRFTDHVVDLVLSATTANRPDWRPPPCRRWRRPRPPGPGQRQDAPEAVRYARDQGDLAIELGH